MPVSLLRRSAAPLALLIVAAVASAIVIAPSGGGAADGVAYVDARATSCRDGRSFDQARSPSTPWCSIERAVAAAPGGAIVEVRAGEYPALKVLGGRARGRTLTLRAYAGERPSLAGVWLRTARLRLEGFAMTGQSTIDKGSRDLQFVGNSFSPLGIQIFSPKDVLIARNRFHGIVLDPGASAPSGYALWVNSGSSHVERCCDRSGLAIRGNRFEDVENDAIQIGGGANDVVIERNRFERIRPTHGAHGDPIQLVGAARTKIRGNRIGDSAAGLTIVHSDNRGTVVENNVITGAGWACDCGHMPRSRFVNNTFWGNGFGGILLVDDQLEDQPATTGVVVRNNILQSLATGGSRTPRRRMFAAVDHNLVPSPGAKGGSLDVAGRPRFAPGGEFRLGPRSPAIDAGASRGAPARDARGYRRVDDPAIRDRGSGSRPWYDIGAFELCVAGGQRPSPRRARCRTR